MKALSRRVNSDVFVIAVTTLLLGGVAVFLCFPSFSRKFFNAATFLAGIAMVCYRRPPRREVLWFIGAMVLFALYRIGHTLWFAHDALTELTQQRYVDSGKRLLGCALLCLFYAGFPLPERWRQRMIGFVAIGLVSGAVMVGWQYFGGNDRPGGELVATSFAYSVVLIFLFFQSALWRPGESWARVSYAVLAVATLTAILFSSTRSAFAVALAFMGWGLFKALHGRRKPLLLWAIPLGMLVVIAVSYPVLLPRIHETVNDLASYFSGSNRTLSIGARFEMWRLALETIRLHPLLGSGYMERLAIASQMVAMHAVDPIVQMYVVNHLHNELLDEWSVRGLLGGVILVLFYCSPLKAFGRIQANPAWVLLLAAALLGLTDVLFQDRANTITLCLLLPLCVGLTQSGKKHHE